jgi:hypothetical protein
MKERSLLQVAVVNAGIYRGSQGASVVVSWALAQRELGHELGDQEGGHLSAAIREYADYWKQSERTAWRDLKRFKAAYPGEESPVKLARLLSRELDMRASEGELVSAPLLPA